MTALDVLRYLVIANSVVLILQSVRVVGIYSSVHALTPKGVHRQLPLHVWLMALAFLTYTVGTTVTLVLDPAYAEFRTVVFGLAGALAQYALWNILRYERRRLTAATNYKDDLF